MADINRLSMQNTPSKLPLPPPVPEPSTSKGMNRSKTVRNLNSAGNKMKGLFKTKEKSKKGEERPAIKTSKSYGPGDYVIYEEFQIPEIMPPANIEQQVNPEDEQLQQELEQLNELIALRASEIETEKARKEKLQVELAEAQRIYKEREVEYSAIEQSFFEHTRTIRATDDDLSTIRDSFKLLKYSIARLIMTLSKKADKAKAAEKFCKTWPHLRILEAPNAELESSLVNLLSEKLVHEHLVTSIFNVPVYPGLKVNEAYDALFHWLQAHSSQFSVRLRQQMASVIAKSGKESDIQQMAIKEKQRIATKIYDDLADIYHPFLRENDAAVEDEKSYFNKICDIVEKTLKLAIAIRGQDVEITTVAIEEGKQEFEEETMTEVKGRTSGVVRFSICPTFIGGDREHGFLEKGKVVVSN
ncbi:hypothetical protein G6F46_001265 [Rhizopus delemar]|uniref:Uncharacterized protein n=3 Tax=Rhizopus TaxID=4842 RepID=I1BWT9_RHIO9|nr:hypothetical protein RO3G_05374 [Rhizopus delemar RA 99-880]KAG1504698.1 hypothetical protein G6F54_000816 [Rhizopus delemar]KAG1552882.1 hypothetical protein G6F51_000939 [Rhizopus arrhizus]KAG1517920.1 hypothetical protein G6F53_000984 [Rhizopus delemar]KAG1574957.1 hypothetical protein G6F50_001506 [Rhizopus delemar]|eukprot:EIE80669.1 hypothetical protein RO3G_05374 [Rhizopus delemar RA 99-880]